MASRTSQENVAAPKPRRRAVAGVLEQDEVPARQLGQPLAERVRADPVVGAVHDEHRAP